MVYNNLAMTKESPLGQPTTPSVLDEIRAERAAVLAEIAKGIPVGKSVIPEV